MSRTDPSTPPGPPGPPPPDPTTHLLALRSVRWAIIGVVASTAIGLVSLFFQASPPKDGDRDSGGTTTSSSGSLGTDGGDDTGGAEDGGVGPGPNGGTATPGPTPTDSGSSSGASSGSDSSSGSTSGEPVDDPSDEGLSGSDDGLTPAEHKLRDALNSDQWSHESCSHAVWAGAEAALYCTVTTVDQYGVTGTGKASVVTYPTKYDRDAVFQSYAGRMQPGDCESQTNVYGSWRENNTGVSAGDVVCFLAQSGQYVFLCSYYDRPALVQITGPDQRILAAWWHTMEPVFTD
ncbi:hypothetical protein OG562_19115 [Streptomyces sp. NBC_01275]|uniref:hypothetical protein n=1 Tax=Streptomyces sp. NBC_01275 TaxID=2903807 RepID=UPI00224C9029|nr:hypothetical protein [Streptomyces sp. NBC_01275]MCX4763051.1 hypothetical protein [Streptomyces sp. NBC_01275]